MLQANEVNDPNAFIFTNQFQLVNNRNKKIKGQIENTAHLSVSVERARDNIEQLACLRLELELLHVASHHLQQQQ